MPAVNNILKMLKIRPVLSHIEVHLVDHCNLNCKGCDHFAPIADKWFADLNVYVRDLRQLQKLFSRVYTIRLLGGEPLLHPDIVNFLLSTRSLFPNTKIEIMTNGILLEKMPDSFWNGCKQTSTEIILDVYPPLYQKEECLLKLAEAKGVRIINSRVQSFQAFLNLNGDSDPNLSFRQCSYRSIHQLKEGKIFTCVVPMVVPYFNKRYGTNLPSAGWIDIHAPNLTGWDILNMLDNCFSTCRYCLTAKEQLANAGFPWSTSSLQMSEWEAATYKQRQ